MTVERRVRSDGMRRLYPLDRRRDRRPLAALALLTLALLGVRALSAIVVAQPGYTDAYYYAVVAERLAHGHGLTADFVWNFLEAPQFAALPVASHRFWMPLASIVPAAGIAIGGGAVGDFRAGQIALILVAACIPLVTFAAARSLGTSASWSLVAATVAGLGGAFAPGWVSIDSFGIAAVLGTSFFLAYARAARGSVRAGLVAGLLVGLLHLARAEGALFGLVLLPLLGRRRTRRAGAVGTAVALAIGLGWLVRGALLTYPEDLVARAMLLVRYEDFFAIEPPTLAGFLAAPLIVLTAKLGALVTNAYTVAFLLLFVPIVPIVVAARRRPDEPGARAFLVLAVLIYLVESLVFTLHSVKGSFPHAFASFFPFAVALAAAGAEHLFAGSTLGMRRLVMVMSVAVFAAFSAFFVADWDDLFNTPYRDRLAAAALLPPGALVARDAAAWRWLTGRETVVAPTDGERAASCVAEIYLAETLILEPAPSTAYGTLYGSERSEYFPLRAERGGIRLYEPNSEQRCIIAGSAAKPPLFTAPRSHARELAHAAWRRR